MGDFDEIQKSIKQLEREVIETRNMNIKTDNTLKSLFSELKKVSGNQERSEKKARATGIGVYVLITVIISVAFFLILRLQAGSLEDKIYNLEEDLSQVKAHAETLKEDLDLRDATEKRALFVVGLAREGKKKEAVAEYAKIDQAKLSKTVVQLFTEKIEGFSRELAQKHYDQGVSQWRIGGYKSAVQDFEASLSYQEKPEYLNLLHYYYGLSLVHVKKIDEGMEMLKAAIAAGLGRDAADKARLTIADTLMGAKRYDEALSHLQAIPQQSCGYYTRQAINMKIDWLRNKLAAKKKAVQ